MKRISLIVRLSFALFAFTNVASAQQTVMTSESALEKFSEDTRSIRRKIENEIDEARTKLNWSEKSEVERYLSLLNSRRSDIDLQGQLLSALNIDFRNSKNSGDSFEVRSDQLGAAVLSVSQIIYSAWVARQSVHSEVKTFAVLDGVDGAKPRIIPMVKAAEGGLIEAFTGTGAGEFVNRGYKFMSRKAVEKKYGTMFFKKAYFPAAKRVLLTGAAALGFYSLLDAEASLLGSLQSLFVHRPTFSSCAWWQFGKQCVGNQRIDLKTFSVAKPEFYHLKSTFEFDERDARLLLRKIDILIKEASR